MNKDNFRRLLHDRLKDAERGIVNLSEELRHISRMYQEIGDNDNANSTTHAANFILCGATQLTKKEEN